MNASFDTYHVERVRSVVNGRMDGLDPRPDQYVARSWERCVRNYQLDPIHSKNSAVLDQSDIREHEDALGELLPIASEESRNIYSQTQGSGYAIIVTDFDGAVMSWIGDPALDKDFNDAGLWIGALWDEEHEGTNGIGTCIAEGRSVTIHREDHFLSKHGALSCTGAPIRNSKGNIIAVLDASGTGSQDSKNSQIYTAALMNMSAKRIEDWYFLHSHRRDTILRLNRRPEMVGTLDDALFAINGDGSILSINNTAVESFCKDGRKNLIGKKIEEV
ncbi:MAG: GAF domain-containing protein, partial [Gammaproteobacteria bacterium]|nr:GAF domain-containing protein [Gammaproteobacteria bacterium]